MKPTKLLLTLFLLQGVLTSSLMAQGAIAAKFAGEIAEQIAKKGGATAAREIAEMGGTAAVREVCEQAEREGGEALVKLLSQRSATYGVATLQAAKGAPKLVLGAVDKLPQELAENGMRAIAREPAAMQKLISETGQEALEAAAKHPGVGSQIATTLGKEGAETAIQLGDDAALALARRANEIAVLPAAERSGLLAAMKTRTAKTLAFLEKHPKGLLTIGAVTAFIAAKDELLGTADAPGFLERVFKEPVRAIGLVAACLLGVWGVMKLLFSYRALKRRAAR